MTEAKVEGRKKGGRKPRMPEKIRPIADEALKRVRRRGAVPQLWEMPKGDDPSAASGWFACPYDKKDEDRWWGLIVDIFGTRQEVVAHVFMNQLASLCGQQWSAPGWQTDESQLMQLLGIINDLRPRNAAEAAYAAQLCALHLSAMKLASSQTRTWGSDPRTAAVLAKTVRAYSDGLLTFERLKGRGQRFRQTIKVEKHSRHEHKHIHLHQEGFANGDQPYEPREVRAIKREAARAPSPGPSLPCSDSEEHALHVPRGQGEKTLPTTRRS